MPVMQVIEAQLRLERGPQRRANSVRLLGQRATGPRFTAAVPVRRRRSTSAGLRRTTFAPVPPPTADRICRRFSRTVHGLVVSRSSMRNGRGSIVAVCASAAASAARSAGPTGATLQRPGRGTSTSSAEPVAISQMRAVPSRPAVARRRPPGAKHIAVIPCTWAGQARVCVQPDGSRSRTTPSVPPIASVPSAGLKARILARHSQLVMVSRCLPRSGSQILIVPSATAVASRPDCGLNAAACTTPEQFAGRPKATP